MRDNVMKNKDFAEKEEQMKKAIMELVKNDDFESINDFYECLHDDKKEVLKYLKWRAAGGKGAIDEDLGEQYIKACNKLIEEIEKEPVKEVIHQEAARIYFDLPHMEKAEFWRTVSELNSSGARFDAKKGEWYVSEDADLSKFEKYLPKEGGESKEAPNQQQAANVAADREAGNIYLKLPYTKDTEPFDLLYREAQMRAELKENGARFDSEKKQWYVSEDADLSKFEKYLPKEAIKYL